LHPLIRDYLAEQFKKHPQHSEIKQALCDLFVSVAEKVEQSTTLAEFNLIEPHLKKMIDWCEGNENLQFALSLNQLATLYDSQGKYDEAEPLFLRSLFIREKQLGENHPDVATNLNNLASLYESQRKYNKAEPLYRRSLAIRENQLGKNHPYVAESLNNLAELYRKQGKYNEADPFHRRSLAIREKQLGENHPHVAQSLNNLALLYNDQGNYADAKDLSERALTICKQELGDHHPHTQDSLWITKMLNVQVLLDCDSQTLLGILEDLAQEAKLPYPETEIELMLLETIATHPQLLQSLREALHG
jgi:tetratricopeptide (TPR) repeat protein